MLCWPPTQTLGRAFVLLFALSSTQYKIIQQGASGTVERVTTASGSALSFLSAISRTRWVSVELSAQTVQLSGSFAFGWRFYGRIKVSGMFEVGERACR